MIIYLVSFISSCIVTCIAQRMFKKENRIIGVICSIIAILIPSIIAGLRDNSVGYDINLYGANQFQLATYSSSFKSYMEICNTDIGYGLINYIISRFTTDIHILLFIINLISAILIYLSAYRNREKAPMWLYMFTYYMMIYNINLNILRQSIAVAIIIYVMKYAEEQKIIKFIIGIIIAILFHSTAIVALPIYFIFGEEKLKRRKIYKGLIIVLLIIFLLNFFSIISFLVNIGLISSKFLSYVDIYSENATDFGYIDGVTRIVFIIMCLMTYKEKINYHYKNGTYIFIMIVDMILMQLSSISGSAQRLAYYYGFPALLVLIPQMPVGFKKKSGNREIILMITIIILIAYWYLKFVYQNFGSTFPYTSELLEIM